MKCSCWLGVARFGSQWKYINLVAMGKDRALLRGQVNSNSLPALRRPNQQPVEIKMYRYGIKIENIAIVFPSLIFLTLPNGLAMRFLGNLN